MLRHRWILHVQAGRTQEAGKPCGNDLRRQLHQRRQQRCAGGIRLAADLRALIGGQVVQRVADLQLDEAALLLDHQDRALAASERAQPLGLQRPGHRDLVERDLRVVLQIEHPQRVHRIGMRPPDGDDADRRIVIAQDATVDPVGARPGKCRRDALHDHPPFKFGAVGGEAQMRIVVQSVRRQREVRRDKAPGGRDDESGGLLSGLGGGLQRNPKSGETRQRDPRQTKLQDVRDRGRVQHRDEHALEDMLGLVRIGRGVRPMVVAGHRQHAAMPRSADEVAAVQRVARAIDAWPFAVPHAEHAIDALAGKRVELLCAIQHGRGEVLVDAWLEADVLGGQHRLAVPRLPIKAAQRRAAIAGDQAAGFDPRFPIEPGLFQQDAKQRLDAGQQDGRVEIGEAALQRGGRMAETDVHLGHLSQSVLATWAILPREARWRTWSWEINPKLLAAVPRRHVIARNAVTKQSPFRGAHPGWGLLRFARNDRSRS